MADTFHVNFKYFAYGIGILLVVIYAAGSGIWVNNSPGWYTSLNRPNWQPPDFVFGIIWPYNFVVIALCAIHIANHQSKSTTAIWLSIFGLSVISALNWAYQFYVPHNLNIASISLIATALLTLPLTILIYKSSIKYGLLFTPYQIWVLLAAALSTSYAIKN